VVFAGGPVQRDGVLGLGRSGDGAAARQVLPGIGVVDLDADPALLAAEVSGVRLFAGYAGWFPGQLDDELAAGGWFVCDATPNDVFTSTPGTLWRSVLRRQGGILATVPEDPSQN
jgi:putative transcriptional regulator